MNVRNGILSLAEISPQDLAALKSGQPLSVSVQPSGAQSPQVEAPPGVKAFREVKAFCDALSKRIEEATEIAEDAEALGLRDKPEHAEQFAALDRYLDRLRQLQERAAPLRIVALSRINTTIADEIERVLGLVEAIVAAAPAAERK